MTRRRRAQITTFAALLSTIFFGLCATTFTLFVRGHDYQWQTVSSMIKVPTLLLLSLLIAYVGALAVSGIICLRLPAAKLWQLSRRSVEITAISLAPLGLLMAAVSISKNYSIVVLSCYGAFILAGIAGAIFFSWNLRRLEIPIAKRKANALALAWAIFFALV